MSGGFDLFIGIDYSGARTPTSRLKAPQVHPPQNPLRRGRSDRMSGKKIVKIAAAKGPPIFTRVGERPLADLLANGVRGEAVAECFEV